MGSGVGQRRRERKTGRGGGPGFLRASLPGLSPPIYKVGQQWPLLDRFPTVTQRPHSCKEQSTGLQFFKGLCPTPSPALPHPAP